MTKGLRDFSRTFGAGEEKIINVEGDYYHVLSATGDVQISFDDSSYITRRAGVGGDIAPYKTVKVKSATVQTVLFAFGFGRLFDSRATASGSFSVTYAAANQITPSALVPIAGGATVLLAAADATRKSVRIGVKATETSGIYIGNIGVGAVLAGGFIEIGGTEYIETEAAVYGYNPSGAAVSVNVMTLERI